MWVLWVVWEVFLGLKKEGLVFGKFVDKAGGRDTEGLSIRFSSCNLAKLLAWVGVRGWKASTSRRIFGLRPEMEQLK